MMKIAMVVACLLSAGMADAMNGLNHHLSNLVLATHAQQNRFSVDLQRIIRARAEGDLPAATLMEAGLERLAASMKLLGAAMDLHEKTILPLPRHLSTHGAEPSGPVPDRSFRPFPDEDERVSSPPVQAKTTARRGVRGKARQLARRGPAGEHALRGRRFRQRTSSGWSGPG